MEKQLPNQPNLDHLRKQAKALRKVNPSLKLSEAQFQLAREYGFESWPKLVHHIESLQLANQTLIEQVEQFKRIRAHNRPLHRAQMLLKANPAIASFDLETACLACEPELVADRLQNETPQEGLIAVTLFGPLAKRHPDKAEQIVAQLLSTGASANSRLPDGEHYTAAYGAVSLPSISILKLLLEHGADPNDNECLYHSCENDGISFPTLLLSYGAKVEGTNALNRMADFEKPDGIRLLLETGYDPNRDGTLRHAIHRGRSAEFLRVLLEFGADPDRPDLHGGTARGLAYQRGYPLDLFDGDFEPSYVDQVLRACALDQMPPPAPEGLKAEGFSAGATFHFAAERGDLRLVQNLLRAGFRDLGNALGGESPLHQASWYGHSAIIRELVEAGADVSLRDMRYQGLPIGWAMYSSTTANHDRHAEAVRTLIELGSPSPGFLMGSDAVVDVLLKAFPELDA